MLPVAVAHSFVGGVVIRYALPGLRMTSCFHAKGSMVRYLYSYAATAASQSKPILLNNKDQQVHIVDCSLEQSLLSTTTLLYTAHVCGMNAKIWK